MNQPERLDDEQAPAALAIELDENGMVVVNDPELLKLVSGAAAARPNYIIGYNGLCGWKMN